MPQISRTTNPTGLKRLDKKHFVVRVQPNASGGRSFWLEKFDLVGSGLDGNLCIACIAHAGNTEEFFKLATLGNPDHEIKPLRDLALDRPLKFRFIIHGSDSAKLVAFADGIRSVDESGLLHGSLVDIEPAELAGPYWRLEIPEANSGTEKPVLLVERDLFPTAHAAANSVWIAVLVMPEVMRQIAQSIAERPENLQDAETWVYNWNDFLKGLGASELAEDSDKVVKDAWINDVVAGFCAKTALKSKAEIAIYELSGGV